MPLLCVIPFFSGDKNQAVHLAKWIRDLGGVKAHDCLLVVDKSTDERGVIEPCREAFNSVEVIWSEPVESKGVWGDGTTDASGPNEMILTAMSYIQHKLKRRWFWLESDACPTRSTWLDEIEAEDKKGAKAFTGAYVDIPPHQPHMTGIAVYPIEVASCSLAMATPGKIAWDYAGREDTIGKGKAHLTDLIQHEYRIHGESPSFPTLESLSVIKQRTAVFHRCKGPDLIDRLRERAVSTPQPKLVVNGPTIPSYELTRAWAEIAGLKRQLSEITRKVVAVPPPTSKPVNPLKKKRVMTPEHKAKVAAGLAKARAVKAARKLTGVK